MAKKSKSKKPYVSSVTGRRTQGFRMINGQAYHPSTTHNSKRLAQERAKEVRNSDYDRVFNARVMKHGDKWTVWVGGFRRSTSGWDYAKKKRK